MGTSEHKGRPPPRRRRNHGYRPHRPHRRPGRRHRTSLRAAPPRSRQVCDRSGDWRTTTTTTAPCDILESLLNMCASSTSTTTTSHRPPGRARTTPPRAGPAATARRPSPRPMAPGAAPWTGEEGDLAADGHHLAGELHARDVGRPARRRRVEAGPLHQVGRVQPGRPHGHQQLGVAGDRVVPLLPVQVGVSDHDGVHGGHPTRPGHAATGAR